MTCTFCQHEFDAAAARHSCSACVVSEGCARVKCPACGYETPEEPRVVSALRNWWQRRRAVPTAKQRTRALRAEISLAELMPGDRATVIDIDRSDRALARKILALGVVPGTPLSLERDRPGVIVTLGATQLAVDHTVAAAVRVRIDG